MKRKWLAALAGTAAIAVGWLVVGNREGAVSQNYLRSDVKPLVVSPQGPVDLSSLLKDHEAVMSVYDAAWHLIGAVVERRLRTRPDCLMIGDQDTSAHTLGLMSYRPSSNEIRVSAAAYETANPGPRLRDAQLARGIVLLSFVHELAHALQHQEWPLRRPPSEAERATREGHAEWIAERAANRAGLQSAWRAMRAIGLGGISPPLDEIGSALSSASAHRRFLYVDGLEFIQAVVASAGTARLADVFARPPSSPYFVDHPSAWLAGDAARDAPAIAAEVLRSMSRNHGWQSGRWQYMSRAAITGELGHEWRSGLRARLEGLAGSWRASVASRGSTGELRVVQFDRPDGALRYVREIVEFEHFRLRAQDSFSSRSWQVQSFSHSWEPSSSHPLHVVRRTTTWFGTMNTSSIIAARCVGNIAVVLCQFGHGPRLVGEFRTTVSSLSE